MPIFNCHVVSAILQLASRYRRMDLLHEQEQENYQDNYQDNYSNDVQDLISEEEEEDEEFDHRKHYFNCLVTYIPTIRGGKHALLDKMIFRQKQINKNFITYRCDWKNCPAGIRVNQNDRVEHISEKWHNAHPNDKLKAPKLKMLAQVKTISRLQPGNNAKAIYRKAVAAIQDDLTNKTSPEKVRIIGSATQFKRTICRHKSRNGPKCPDTVDEIVLGPEQKTYNSPFDPQQIVDFLIDDKADENGQNRIVVFGTINNLLKLGECNKIYGDGTFKQAPELFYQLYSLHGKLKGKMFPLVYAILPNKTHYQTYYRMLKIVQEKLISLQGRTMKVQEFQMDFGRPMMLAIKRN